MPKQFLHIFFFFFFIGELLSGAFGLIDYIITDFILMSFNNVLAQKHH